MANFQGTGIIKTRGTGVSTLLRKSADLVPKKFKDYFLDLPGNVTIALITRCEKEHSFIVEKEKKLRVTRVIVLSFLQ